jgi:hypothetical protein
MELLGNILAVPKSMGGNMNTQKLSTDVLRALAAAQSTPITLDDLCHALGVTEGAAREGVRPRKLRREDVRTMVRRLDAEGFVDASRMRLTLQGFALAAALPLEVSRQLYLVA